MKKYFYALVVMLPVLFLFSCKKTETIGPDPTPPVITQTDIAAVNSKVTGFMNTYNIPGASLAVTKNGKLVYAKGFGKANTTTGELVTPASRFRLASVSKTYTGVAILKLVQNGSLNLDAKVFGTGGVLGSDYGTAPYNANLLNITVRHLLQNVSGAWGAASGGDVIGLNPTYNYKQFFDWVINTRPNPNVPGTVYDYSNVNFVLAARIVEKISGKTFINFIKEDIMQPLGGTQTDIAGKTLAEKKPNEVVYYGQGVDATNNYVYDINFDRRDGDGGIITTAPELLRFVNAIDGSATRPDILNASNLVASYGCGIGIWSAENIWYNYGSLPGTRTAFMRNANGVCVALLLNSRVDPAAGENPFIFAMQDVCLDITKNASYNWQDIDQF
jgi:D-alanyl-D-alanine carboxypeptidase